MEPVQKKPKKKKDKKPLYILTGFLVFFGVFIYLITRPSNQSKAIKEIETCFNNNNGGGGSANSLSTESSTVAAGLHLYNSQDNTADVCTNATVPSSSTSRPNLRVSYSNVTPTIISWTPTTDLYSNAGATTAYTNENINTVFYS